MTTFNRRTMLKLIGSSAAAAAALRRPLWAAAAAPASSDDFFIFVHAGGGWDVTLWADPRNEKKGIVDPASTENTDIAPLLHWKSAKLEGDVESFEILTPNNVAMRLGPGIGEMFDLRDRMTVINGLAMNTVSHPDGTAFSATGRHLAGGRPPASSVDVAVANELGTTQELPDVSINFPSSYIGEKLDRRAIPLRVASAATIAKSLARSDAYFSDDDRGQIIAVLGDEAKEIATRSSFPETYARLAAQDDALPHLLGNELKTAFTQQSLQAAYPQFDYKPRFIGGGVLAAAFAIEAMKRNLVRCVSFALGGFDTHGQNYKNQAHTQQELFGTLAQLVKTLDKTPHPTRKNLKLSERTHIMVVSDFCRTPQINMTGGRDHYPNNSALVISPKFRGGKTFGKSDFEQVLPADSGIKFADGPRPIAPPDLLATFLAAFGIEPGRYLRDGEVVKEMLV
jgi:hypothetical protein